MRRMRNFWNNLSIFWKSFFIFLGLSLTVVTLGEGLEDVAEDFLEFAGHHSQSGEFLSWLLATIIASLAASLMFSRLSGGPLKSLHRMAMKLSEGDLSARLGRTETGWGDEIGDLARTLNRMADSLERLVADERRLTRDISHELRSPLSRLRMIPDMLEKKPENSARYLAQLEKDVACMEAMISRMLDQARLETMLETGLEKGAFDLAALVRESVDELNFQAAEEGKSIALAAPPSLACSGNGLILKMAVDNPLRNALHYTAAGTTVSVRLRREGAEALLEIADEGPGVPEEFLPDIFRPFFRVDPARSRQSGGFGLGLSIAHRAAGAHGGRLDAANIIKDGRRAGLLVTLRLTI